MQTERLVDIIIPIYNREACIPTLIEQLDRQTFRNFRAIFVDDGSTDASVEKLERVLPQAGFDYHIVRKENGGAASARNAGIHAATAPFIAFMDSDDGVLPQFLEYLYTAATETNADICSCGFQMLPVGSGIQPKPVDSLVFQSISPAQAMTAFYQKWVGVVCLLINRRFLQESGVLFDEQCIYHEDIPFITELIEASHSFTQIDGDLYLYYAALGSLSRSPRIDKYESGIACFERTVAKMRQSDSDAAAVFCRMGASRYYIATLRKMAVQLPYTLFKKMAFNIDFRQYKEQIRCLSRSQQMACRMFLLSKRLFYAFVRLLYND
ncbi:MAG: glycosyltransferase [Clostridia bacterium]|nr:glycosyltransferase [Clostridia bacterium]